MPLDNVLPRIGGVPDVRSVQGRWNTSVRQELPDTLTPEEAEVLPGDWFDEEGWWTPTHPARSRGAPA